MIKKQSSGKVEQKIIYPTRPESDAKIQHNELLKSDFVQTQKSRIDARIAQSETNRN